MCHLTSDNKQTGLWNKGTNRVAARGIHRSTYSETAIMLGDGRAAAHRPARAHGNKFLWHAHSERVKRGEYTHTHTHTHVSGVGLTYENLSVAQRRNIVWKCQGSAGSPTGIKCTVNTHRAQSVLAKTYGSHLSHSMLRQIVSPPQPPHIEKKKSRAAQQDW